MYRSVRFRFIFSILLLTVIGRLAIAQGNAFKPVTDAMLQAPDVGDWLMLSRTYDEQRFSPLQQVK